MRTFAHKQHRSQKPMSSGLAQPHLATPGQVHHEHPLLPLQRLIGNQAVLQMLQTHTEERDAGLTTAASHRFGHDCSRIPIHSSTAGALQTKLAVNQPGDEYEQEAERISEQIMRMHEPQLQRVCTCGGACPECQAEQPDQQQEHLQTKHIRSADLGQGAAPSIVNDILAAPGQALDAATRAFLEPRFGHDFSQVRVHTESAAGQSAREVNAHAYTVGRDIVFGAGRFAPESREGGHLLAHELTHVVQQSGGVVAIQRQPVTPDPSAERTAAVAEAEAVARVTTEELEAQSEAEDALKLNWHKRKDRSYALLLGVKDRARLQKGIELSPKFQQEITVKVRFFSGEAKAAYIQTISPVLSQVAEPEQITEILEGPISTGTTEKQPKPKLTCDIGQKHFLLEYEDEPAKTRCMDIMTDPEFINNYFDTNIASVVGYSVQGTSWQNVEYGSFKVMLVKYKNGTSEYSILDDVGNFYYGGKQLTLLEYTYLKRKNGLVYPLQNGQIYFSELLTPNIISYKNGLRYQTKELQDLYTLLQVAGTFASIMGFYAVGEESFKASINAFARSGPAALPGSPLPGSLLLGRGEKSAAQMGSTSPATRASKATTQREEEEIAAEQLEKTAAKGTAGPKTVVGWTFNPKVDAYVKTHDEAVREAFLRTGVPLEEFTVTEVAKTADGKTIPVEWSVLYGPNRGAQVNIDDPTIVPTKEGPQVPHVGYQAPGKRYAREGVRGHIIPTDGVLASRAGLGQRKQVR